MSISACYAEPHQFTLQGSLVSLGHGYAEKADFAGEIREYIDEGRPDEPKLMARLDNEDSNPNIEGFSRLIFLVNSITTRISEYYVYNILFSHIFHRDTHSRLLYLLDVFCGSALPLGRSHPMNVIR